MIAFRDHQKQHPVKDDRFSSTNLNYATFLQRPRDCGDRLTRNVHQPSELSLAELYDDPLSSLTTQPFCHQFDESFSESSLHAKVRFNSPARRLCLSGVLHIEKLPVDLWILVTIRTPSTARNPNSLNIGQGINACRSGRSKKRCPLTYEISTAAYANKLRRHTKLNLYKTGQKEQAKISLFSLAHDKAATRVVDLTPQVLDPLERREATGTLMSGVIHAVECSSTLKKMGRTIEERSVLDDVPLITPEPHRMKGNTRHNDVRHAAAHRRAARRRSPRRPAEPPRIFVTSLTIFTMDGTVAARAVRGSCAGFVPPQDIKVTS